MQNILTRHFRSIGALYLSLAMLTVIASAQDQKARAIAAGVDNRYQYLLTLKADFVEIFSGAGVTRSESGTLLLKRPGKMRWDYKEPREKLFLSDGKTAYFYVPGEREARRGSIKKLDDLRSPLRYLLGKAKLLKEFDDLKIAEGAKAQYNGNVVLSGIPKHLADRVNQVLLEITPNGQLQRIVIEELDGAITEFRFTQIRENEPVPDQKFRFVPPPGVAMIEASDLAGN